MLRTLALLTTLSLLSGSQLFAQPAELWTRTYGGASFDYCYSVRPTADNGFILAGYTQSFGAGSQDVYLVRADAAGDTLWTNTYGSTESDAAWQVRAVDSGGYILSGFTHRFPGQSRDIWLLRVNDNGDTLWTNYFTGAQWDDAFTVTPTRDGGFLLGGYTTSYGAGANDFYIIKTDSQGDSLWSRTYGASNVSEYCTTVLEVDDGYLLGGYSGGALSSEYWLIRTDQNGDSLWSVRPAQGQCYSLRETSDGGFVMIGESFVLGEDSDWLLVKLSQGGQTEWTSTFGGELDDIGSVVEETSDGGFICGGYMVNAVSQDQDFVFLKASATGDSLWSTSHGGLSNESCSSVQQLADGSFVGAGGTFSEGEGLYDFYLVRLESEVTPPITVSDYTLDFGLCNTNAVCFRTLSVMNNTDEDILISGISHGPPAPFGIFTSQLGLLHGGQIFNQVISFGPTEIGTFYDTLRLEFDAVNSPIIIPMQGTGVIFELSLDPPGVDFGEVMVGESETQAVTISNIGSIPCTISGGAFVPPNDQFTITGLEGELPPAGELTFGITFAPQSTSEFTVELYIDHNIPPELTISMPVSGRGVIGNAIERNAVMPGSFYLAPAYPNPFNPETTISFGLPQASHVELSVFDITGRKVSTLTNMTMSAGHHNLTFNANDLPSGVYFYRLDAQQFTATRKMVLLK